MMWHPQVELQMVELHKVISNSGVQPSGVRPEDNLVEFQIHSLMFIFYSRHDGASPGRTPDGRTPEGRTPEGNIQFWSSTI